MVQGPMPIYGNEKRMIEPVGAPRIVPVSVSFGSNNQRPNGAQSIDNSNQFNNLHQINPAYRENAAEQGKNILPNTYDELAANQLIGR